jgi:sarcosine oxidase gamma subunit
MKDFGERATLQPALLVILREAKNLCSVEEWRSFASFRMTVLENSAV